MTQDAPITLARMLRPARTSLALVLCLAAGTLAACGSEDEGTIPQDNSDAMLATLDQVENAVEEGNCEIAANGVAQLNEQVNTLPKEAGVEVKDDLRRLVDNLDQQVNDPNQCEAPDTTKPDETEPDTDTDTGTSGEQGVE